MTVMDAVPIVSSCFDSGVVLAVLDGGKLSIKGNKSAPVVSELISLVNQDRKIVLAAIETVTMQRAAIAGWNADKVAPKLIETPEAAPVVVAEHDPPQPDLFSVDTLPKDNFAPEIATPTDGLNVRTDDLQKFVGVVVSDNDMMILYYRAHRVGAKLTSEWMADTLPCDHRVTGYFAGVSHEN